MATAGQGTKHKSALRRRPTRLGRRGLLLVRATGHESAGRQLLLERQQQRDELRALTARLAETAEAERASLARELHDQLGQSLTALGINLSLIRSLLPGPDSAALHGRIDESIGLLGQIGDCVRSVTDQLRPPVLDDYGLAPAIKWYAGRQAARTGVAIRHESRGEPCPRLAIPIEMALFRIVQEALTNVAKHAGATEVTITIDTQPDMVRIEIADNGRGFDSRRPRADERSRCLGLLIMGERAKGLGGSCRVEASPGHGTRVTAEVPR